jgi:hypothetical protein
MSLSSIVLLFLADMPKNETSNTQNVSWGPVYSLLACLALCNWLHVELGRKRASCFNAVVLKWTPYHSFWTLKGGLSYRKRLFMNHNLTNSCRKCSCQENVLYVLRTSQHSYEVSST